MKVLLFFIDKGRRFLLPFFIFIGFSLYGYTFSFYIDGDNSLYQESEKDVEEILNSFNPDKNDVCIILWDRYGEKPLIIVKNYYSTDTTCLSFSINSGSADSYRLLGEITKDYAKKGPLYLVLWDHGNAWIKKDAKGFGYDSEFDDYLDVWNGELNRAIKEFTDIAGKCDALIFDACIMQTIEVDYEIKDYTQYIVASQDPVPIDGMPYKEWLEKSDFNNVLSSLKNLVDLYNNKYSSYDVSLSVISTYEMNNWWFYFNDKIKKYIETNSLYSSYRTPFSYNFFLTNNDNIDINGIYPVTVYSKSTVQRNGISAWFPQTKDAYDDYIDIYSKLLWSKNTRWDEYIGRVLYKGKKFEVLPPDSIVISDKIEWNRGYSIYGIKGYNVNILKNMEFYAPEIVYNTGFSDYNNMLFAKTGTLIVDSDYNITSLYGRLNLWIYKIDDADTLLIEYINKSLKDTLKRIYKGKIMFVNINENNNYVYLDIRKCKGELLSSSFVSDTAITFLSPYDTMLIMVNAEDSINGISPFVYKLYYNDDPDISVYPQPAVDYVVFNIGDILSNIYVYTISGKLVKAIKNVSGKVEWDLKNKYNNKVKTGVYIVYVSAIDRKKMFIVK